MMFCVTEILVNRIQIKIKQENNKAIPLYSHLAVQLVITSAVVPFPSDEYIYIYILELIIVFEVPFIWVLSSFRFQVSPNDL